MPDGALRGGGRRQVVVGTEWVVVVSSRGDLGFEISTCCVYISL
jgi:hypothetical protein